MRGRAGVFTGSRGQRPGLLGLSALATALALGACGTGSGNHFADTPRPPVPVDLTVYVDNSHVAISPSQVGAGPVILYVTNQASRGRTVSIKNRGGSAIASSGPINSGQTAQITANLKRGTYAIATGSRGLTAKLRIGRARQNADNVLLQP